MGRMGVGSGGDDGDGWEVRLKGVKGRWMGPTGGGVVGGRVGEGCLGHSMLEKYSVL